MRETGRWLAIAVLVVILDQLTKMWAQTGLAGGPIYVLPVFQLYLTYNTGAAFSLLADAGGWQKIFFSVLALITAVLIVWQLIRQRRYPVYCAGLALVLGGAIGNLLDRLWLGRVVDFLDAHWGPHHFPVFNVADCAITVGAMLLLWMEGRDRRR